MSTFTRNVLVGAQGGVTLDVLTLAALGLPLVIVGRRLFSHLPGAHRCYALIALPNDASIALHARFGFREMGTMTEAGHKLGRYWDVLWMERNVS